MPITSARIPQLCRARNGGDRMQCVPPAALQQKFPQDIGKGRPCLNAHIGRCMAVCSGKISQEDYNEAVQSAVHMIQRGQGRSSSCCASAWPMQPNGWISNAALIRDQIAAIEKVSQGPEGGAQRGGRAGCGGLRGHRVGCMRGHSAFPRGTSGGQKEFLFHDTQDIPPCGGSFLPAIIWRTTSSSEEHCRG